MLTYTIAEYLWLNDLDTWMRMELLEALLKKQQPQWEPADEVERLMRQRPEKGGVLYNLPY